MKNNLTVIPQGKYCDLIEVETDNDLLTVWSKIYFTIEVTTLPSSRKVQKRDIDLFISFIIEETGSEGRVRWTPRLSADFKKHLQRTFTKTGKRHWNDKTVNRILAHNKTFSKWIHKHAPFPLGNPMEKLKSISVGNSLDVERAITKSERRDILDQADKLPDEAGRSKDRERCKDVKARPVRKDFRPYRNRAIIYTLMETGMRRGAATRINLCDIDFDKKFILVEEKGAYQVKYNISQEGIEAIRDYVIIERESDLEYWQSPALFLPAKTNRTSTGRLSAWSINKIWNDVCEPLSIQKTPHCARHAMGKYIMDKTGNIAAVQRQLGHVNATYSMQYARATDKEISNLLNDR